MSPFPLAASIQNASPLGARGRWAERIPPTYALLRMYTDWSSVILLLLTAVPLAVVVGVTGFFIWKQKGRKRT